MEIKCVNTCNVLRRVSAVSGTNSPTKASYLIKQCNLIVTTNLLCFEVEILLVQTSICFLTGKVGFLLSSVVPLILAGDPLDPGSVLERGLMEGPQELSSVRRRSVGDSFQNHSFC